VSLNEKKEDWGLKSPNLIIQIGKKEIGLDK